MNLNEKSDLFFCDYSIMPLFVQENYLMVEPGGGRWVCVLLLLLCFVCFCFVLWEIPLADSWNRTAGKYDIYNKETEGRVERKEKSKEGATVQAAPVIWINRAARAERNLVHFYVVMCKGNVTWPLC